MHTSKTGDEVKKALVDVDGLWTKHRLVLYSPTISAGVDFSAEHFDRMYLYVCPLSCTPMGTLQMTGRVRKLRDQTIVCCTSPNMRLTGTASRRAVTYAETMKFLRWMDSRIQEKQLLTRQLARFRVSSYKDDDDDLDEDECVSGSVTLPEESPLLALQARELGERENAASRFFFEFRDMAVAGGHAVEVLSDASLTEEALIHSVEDEAAQPAPAEGEPDGKTTVIGKMLVGALVPVSDDMTPEEHFKALETRLFGNEATEDDKWAHYAKSYMVGWGLDRLDEPFLREHDVVRPKCPKVAQLIRVLYPPLCAEATLESAVSARVSILRTPMIREVLQALGFRSPFDTEHRIPDLMATWEAGLKDVEFFRTYRQSAKLFDVNGRTSAWSLNTVSKALGIVLGCIGLKLESTRKQCRLDGKKKETYTYSLDEGQCAEMLELVRLKMRGSDYRAAAPNAHARELLLRDEFPRYGHLIDLERGGRSAYAWGAGSAPRPPS